MDQVSYFNGDEPNNPQRSRRFRQRRRLIVGLTLGGVGLAAIGSCIAVRNAISALNYRAPYVRPPVDKHRMLNFPLKLGRIAYTWLPDSRHMLCCDSQTFFLLDAKSGQKVWEQKCLLDKETILWSSDRQYFFEVGTFGTDAGNARATVWDIQRKRLWNSPPLRSINLGILSPDGASFAMCLYNPKFISGPYSSDVDTSDNNTVQIWDMQKKRLMKVWNVHDILGPAQSGVAGVSIMRWSPDNTRLAMICAGGSVQVWQVADAQRLWTYQNSGERVYFIQWSPDGTSLALWLDIDTSPPIKVLDAHTGQPLFQAAGANLDTDYSAFESGNHDQFLCWSNDNTRLALIAYENSAWRVQVRNARTGRHLFTCQSVDADKWSTCISWSPNGRYLAGAVRNSSNALIQFWDAQNGKALFSYQVPLDPRPLLWSPDSQFLSTCTPQNFEQEGRYTALTSYALQVFHAPT